MEFGNVVIFGDSYSTFDGYIPSGYEPYYSEVARDGQGVDRVDLTWWHRFIVESGATLVRNDSYSGSTVGYTGYDGADTSKTTSFICRAERLIEEGFFEKNAVDTAIIFGGTNDSWANAPVGELKYGSLEKADLYYVLPAFCYLVDRLRKIPTLKRVVAVINTELKPEITDGFKKACAHYGATCVDLRGIDKIYAHPTALGMEQICKQILEKTNL